MNEYRLCCRIQRICVALCLSWITATGSAGATEVEASHEEEGHRRNALGVFLGATHEEGENRATWGIEYTYRFHPRWSVGGVIERAERDERSTLAVAFVHFFVTEGLFLGSGIGRKDPGEERENTLRLTIGYEFELGGGWSLAPDVTLDVIEGDENEEVVGLTIGRRF